MRDNLHNKRLGKKGENKTARYLKRRGYKILERNYRSPFGEVDIIAKKGDIVAFVEVKTRLSDSFGAPADSVRSDRKLRYVRAAKAYAANLPDCIVRFDVAEVFKTGINYLDNAFDASSR